MKTRKQDEELLLYSQGQLAFLASQRQRKKAVIWSRIILSIGFLVLWQMATYYKDLVKLFNEVPMEPEDTLVDYGCGLGRVLFYANNRHYCKTTGIEGNADIYGKLMENVKGYQGTFLEQEDRMKFYNVSALDYQISPEDNYFYFFNPFSHEVFREVIEKIMESAKAHPRDINLLVYYPTYQYLRVIRESKMFIQKKFIKLSNYEKDHDEKVIVYHLSKGFLGL